MNMKHFLSDPHNYNFQNSLVDVFTIILARGLKRLHEELNEQT